MLIRNRQVSSSIPGRYIYNFEISSYIKINDTTYNKLQKHRNYKE